jgi:hypothetical protein
MAVLYMTGWEGGSIAWYQQSQAAWTGIGAVTINTTVTNLHRTAGGFGGSYSVSQGTNASSSFACAAGTVPAGTARWLHYWMLYSAPGTNNTVAVLAIGGTAQATVVFTIGGSVQLYVGAALVATSASPINVNVGHWVAIEGLCANVGGILRVYVDGVLSVQFLGDTQNAAVPDWDQFAFGRGAFAVSTPGFASQQFIDDVIVTDNITGRVPEHYLVARVPTSDSAPLTLTPSTGVTHFNLVDEIPPVDTDYNSTAVSGNEDFYGKQNLPVGIVSVLALNVCARVTKDGALTQAEAALRNGATTVYDTPRIMPASPSFLDIQYLLDVNPDGGGPWSLATVNTAFIGCRFTT